MLVPSTRTQLGRWSFHVAAPAVWNVLHHIFAHYPSVVDSSGLVENPSLHTGLQTPLRTFVEERILLHLHYIFIGASDSALMLTLCALQMLVLLLLFTTFGFCLNWPMFPQITLGCDQSASNPKSVTKNLQGLLTQDFFTGHMPSCHRINSVKRIVLTAIIQVDLG